MMNPDRIEQTVIQWECQQLLNRVVSLTDRQDWEALANCYAEDAVLSRPSDPDNPIQGRQAILESFKARPPRTSGHMVGNAVFTLHSKEHVESVSRVWLVTGPASDSLPVVANGPLLVGTFIDQLKWNGQRWLVAHRDGSMELKYGE